MLAKFVIKQYCSNTHQKIFLKKLSVSQNIMRVWSQFIEKLQKIGQIWPKTNIFEVGQLFWKKYFFLKTIPLKDSLKFFLKIFGHFRPFYENLIWDHFFCIFVNIFNKCWLADQQMMIQVIWVENTFFHALEANLIFIWTILDQ